MGFVNITALEPGTPRDVSAINSSLDAISTAASSVEQSNIAHDSLDSRSLVSQASRRTYTVTSSDSYAWTAAEGFALMTLGVVDMSIEFSPSITLGANDKIVVKGSFFAAPEGSFNGVPAKNHVSIALASRRLGGAWVRMAGSERKIVAGVSDLYGCFKTMTVIDGPATVDAVAIFCETSAVPAGANPGTASARNGCLVATVFREVA